MGSDWGCHVFVGRVLSDEEAKELWETQLRDTILNDDSFDIDCLYPGSETPSPHWLMRDGTYPIRVYCPCWSFRIETTPETPFHTFKWFVEVAYFGYNDYVATYEIGTFQQPKYQLIVAMDYQ